MFTLFVVKMGKTSLKYCVVCMLFLDGCAHWQSVVGGLLRSSDGLRR